MKRLNIRGFSAIEIVIVVVVLIAIVASGYWLLKKQDRDANTSSNTNSTQTTEQVANDEGATAAPEVNDTKDLDEAVKVLDQTNPDDSSNDSELDEQLKDF